MFIQFLLFYWNSDFTSTILCFINNFFFSLPRIKSKNLILEYLTLSHNRDFQKIKEKPKMWTSKVEISRANWKNIFCCIIYWIGFNTTVRPTHSMRLCNSFACFSLLVPIFQVLYFSCPLFTPSFSFKILVAKPTDFINVNHNTSISALLG